MLVFRAYGALNIRIAQQFVIRPRKKYDCVAQVTRPTLNFLPPTLNVFFQILKLEENSRTK